MSRTWFGIAGILGALGVAFGAFGAHALQSTLNPGLLAIFETAVRYHLIHTLALAGTAIAMQVFPGHGVGLRRVAWAFTVGVVLFSGSLYVLALTNQRWLGAVTPLGGLAFIAGWLGLAVVFLRRRAS